ncbi:HORMA domain-containing protein [Filobasidium floriforme]|uniref:HORMA domain-containing protein n=1 Tax=Filobasidium floriforme TaxID=5210 RepID=UPI001E8CFEA6|nr:HORMA domain-containing protein [Filobasidium floriforme]KAH8083706.1 HORMA domain-containing protein [Filobasidium floriforme]
MPTAQKSRSKAKSKTTAAAKQAAEKAKLDQIEKTKLDTAICNRTQSTLIVNILLEATFGCMTFLRGLLPDDNFTDKVVLVPNPDPLHAPSAPTPAELAALAEGSQPPPASQYGKTATGLKVKSLIRGYSPEADKVLGWLDGIMEAVEKQYLKTCVFAIYLDPNEPEKQVPRLIETLTVSFHYPLVPGTDIRVPEMEISDHLSHLGLDQTKRISSSAAVGTRTVGEVKRALRRLVKSLILVCQNMGELPAQKFGNMKLVYNESAPADYEAPNFVPLALEKQQWHFTTHEVNEKPDRTFVGAVESGHHSISVKVASIIKEIPRPVHVEEEDAMEFGVERSAQVTTKGKRKREDEQEEQREDALRRKIVWSADQDAEDRSLIDPEYRDAEGEPENSPTSSQEGSDGYRPYGIMADDGAIMPIPEELMAGARRPHIDEGEEKGEEDDIAMEVDGQEVSPTLVSNGENSRAMQPIDIHNVFEEMLNPEPVNMQLDRQSSNGLRAEFSKNVRPGVQVELDDPVSSVPVPETTVIERHESIQIDAIALSNQREEDIDSIASFSQLDRITHTVRDVPAESSQVPSSQRRSPRQSRPVENINEKQGSKGSKSSRQASKEPCVCGDPAEDLTMVACESCERWFHMPCTGHLEPKNLPETYYCTVCILVLTGNGTKAAVEHVETYLPGIALLRRGLWVGYTEKCLPDEIALCKRLGCGPQDTKQLVERMTDGGFLVPIQIDAKNKRGKKARGWTFVNNITQSNKLRTWFTPGGTLERNEFGVNAKMVKAFRNWKGGPQSDLQDSQIAAPKQRGGKPTDIQDEGVQITESHPNPQIKSHSDSQSRSQSDSPSQVRPNGKHQTLHTREPVHQTPALTEENNGGKAKEKEKEKVKEKEAEEMIVDEIEEFDRDPTPTPRPASTPKGRREREVISRPAGNAAGGSQLRSGSQSQARSQAGNKDVNRNNDGAAIVTPVPTKLSSQAAQVQVPALASQLRPTRTRRERVSAARSFVDMGTLY